MHFPCFINVFVLCTKLCWYCFWIFIFCQRINSRIWKCQLEKPFQWWCFNIWASRMKWGEKKKKRMKWGTFLVVQWLRLWTSTAGGVGSILGGVTKILHATGSRQKKKLKKWTARRLSGPALDVRFFHQYGSSQNHQGESCLPASTCRSWSTVLRKGSPGHKHNMPEPEAPHSPYCVLGLQS